MNAPRVLMYDYPSSICCQMVRLTLAEKGVRYERQTIDIIVAKEQFEPWYLALNPKGVVPTLRIDDEIIIDTMNIVPRIDAQFDGPPLTPQDEARADEMRRWMVDIMAIHYGVMLYSRELDENGRSAIIVGRGDMLRRLRDERPESAAVLDKRIAGNERLQRTLSDPAEVLRHVDGVHDLVRKLDAVLVHHEFVAGNSYSLADTYATAALARFELHGYAGWWQDGALANVERYYERMQARPSWTAAGVVSSE